MTATRARDASCPPADPIVSGRTRMQPGTQCCRHDGLPNWLLTYSVRGTATFELSDGGMLQAGPGALVLVAPRVRQNYFTGRTGGAWEVLWLVFEAPAHWQPWLKAWPQVAPGYGHLDMTTVEPRVRGRITDQLRLAHDITSSSVRHGDMLAMNALEAALIWIDNANPSAALSALDPRLQRAVRFIRAHLADPIGLMQIAAAAAVSPAHLSRLFGRDFQTSPVAYLEKERLTRAAHLLTHTSLPVKTIAAEVGFASPFYFATRFRRFSGMAPTAWRHAPPP